MSAITGHHSICKEICDALGLKHVKKLQLNMAVNEIVTIDVELYPDIDGVKHLPAIFKRFELIEKLDPEKYEDTTTIGDSIETHERIKT